MSTSTNITLHVRMSSGSRFDVVLTETTLEECTVLKLKDVIAGQQTDTPSERQRLIYKGRILDNDRTLSDYGIVDGATLHLVKGSAPASKNTNAGSGTTTSTTTPAATTTAPTTTNPTTTSNPNPFGTNPFGSMAGNGNPFGSSMTGGVPPNLQQMQQEMMQNPEAMQQMMQSPMMQALLDNPEFMRTMMQSNPQMRQLMESNPQLREMINDPQLMRQSLEMMRNPAAMQHMMRSQDLAMSQLENIPGGFAALSSMYRNVQEPMMDAMAPGSTENSTSGTQSSNAANSGDGAAGTAMPNPWGGGGATATTGTNANRSTTPGTTGTTPTSSSQQQQVPPPVMMNPWGSGATGTGTNPFTPPVPGQQPTPQQMEQTLQMLENPMVAQMMDQVLQNPEAVRQMMEANPMMAQLRAQNPGMAQAMENPEMLRTMMNPNNLRAMMQMQSAMQQLQQGGALPPIMPGMMGSGTGMPGTMGATSGTGMGSMPPSTSAAPPPGGLDFSSLLNQMQSTNISPQSQPPAPMRPPQERFRHQLQSLRDMGFEDEEENIRALQSNHGNLNRAVDQLIMGGGGSSSGGGSAPAPAPAESSAATNDAPAPAPAAAEPEPQEPPETEPKDSADKKND